MDISICDTPQYTRILTIRTHQKGPRFLGKPRTLSLKPPYRTKSSGMEFFPNFGICGLVDFAIQGFWFRVSAGKGGLGSSRAGAFPGLVKSGNQGIDLTPV